MDNIFDIRVNLEYDKKMRFYKQKHKKTTLEDLYHLREIIKDNNIDKLSKRLFNDGFLPSKKFEYIYLLKDIVLFYKTIKKNKKYHLCLTKHKKLIKPLYKSEIETKNKVSLDECIYYAEEFMKQYNPDLYEIFEQLYKNNHIKFMDPIEHGIGGVMYPINEGLPYVVIYKRGDIYDAGSIVHEVAHCYQQIYTYDRKKDNPDFYSEVYSHYVQMLFYEYMKNNIVYKDDIKNIKRFSLENLRCRLVRLDEYFKDMKLNGQVYSDILYAYGISLALYYYDMHLKNPDDAEYYMNWFVKTSCLYKQEDVLNKYAINKDKILTNEIIQNYMK